jgi:nucleoside-diphosphate-sugar epimerase
VRVLVTGGEGYIGTVLTSSLVGEGHSVTVLDTGFHRDGHLYTRDQVETCNIRTDLRRVEPDMLRGFEAVVHLGDLSNDPLSELNADLTVEINHLSAVRLAQLAKDAGVKRFVYSSSCSVYGASGSESDDLSTEETAVAPITTYATCKVLVEDALRELSDSTFNTVSLRNATAFGASPRMRFDLVVNELTAQAFLDRKLVLTSDGTPWRPFVHVRDIAKAICCCLSAPPEVVQSEVFNVGDSRTNHQVRDVCEIIGRVFPDCEVILGDLGDDQRNYRVDFSKITTSLPGYSSDWTVDLGVREMYGIFQAIGLTRETLNHRLYRRLMQVTHLLESGQIDSDLFWIEAKKVNPVDS